MRAGLMGSPGVGRMLVLAGAAVIIVTGCSSGGSTAGQPVPLSDQPGPPTGAQVLPIFSYLQTSSESQTQDQAYNILVARCMAGFGFSDPQQAFVAPDPPPMYRRYGVTSMAIASRWGYHLEPGSALLVKEPPRAPQSEAEMAVLLGTRSRLGNPHYSPFGNGPRISVGKKLVPAGGCAGLAIRRLGDYGRGSDPTLANQINLDTYSQSLAVPAVIRALRAWSQCMAARGYSFHDPKQAMASFNISTATPSQREIDATVADVTCKDRTGLVRVWFAVEYRLEEAAIQRHILALDAIRAKLAQVQRAAIAMIAAAGG